MFLLISNHTIKIIQQNRSEIKKSVFPAYKYIFVTFFGTMKNLELLPNELMHNIENQKIKYGIGLGVKQ